MTHKDIYTKFMIEYDKANVTSSYPSLTEYEVATVLDKAYNALIAQKVTGNNIRRVALEGDLKNIEDLRPLMKKDINLSINESTDISNMCLIEVPNESLYVMQVMLWCTPSNVTDDDWKNHSNINPIDGETTRLLYAKHVSHQMAEKFYATAHNIPWVKQPVYYLEDGNAYIVYDSIFSPDTERGGIIVYIKKPNPFVKDLDKVKQEYGGESSKVSYFDYKVGDNSSSLEAAMEGAYKFECNDTVAEELISLAVAFALENVESQRLNSKLNMRGLEA